MGAIAAEHADRVYVTDDNPRSEDPAAIRRAILDAAPGAIEIGDRAEAIATAVAALGSSGDLAGDRRQGPRDRARSSATRCCPSTTLEVRPQPPQPRAVPA